MPPISSSVPSENEWRKCSSCKKSIGFGIKYWVCNVSTCNRKRTGLIFCTVSCWDAHCPMMNHRESWAEERTAPSRAEWAKTLAGEDEKPTRKKRTQEIHVEEKAPVSTDHPKVILRRPRSE